MLNRTFKWYIMVGSCLLLGLTRAPAQSNHSVADIERLMELEAYEEVLEATTGLSMTSSSRSLPRLYQLRADAFYYVNDIQRSLDHYLLAIEAAGRLEEPNQLHLLEAISHAGFCYRELGLYDKAVAYYRQALDQAIALQDSVEMASQYANLGHSYGKVGDFKKGIEFLNRAYAIDIARKDTAALGFDLRDMASLQTSMGNHRAAINNLKESIFLLNRSKGNANSLAMRLGSIGNAYAQMDVYDSAEHYLKESLLRLETLGDSLNMAHVWVDLARLYNQRGDFPAAYQWGRLAKEYYLDIGAGNHWVRANLSLIDAHFQSGDYDQAMQLVNENLAAEQIHDLLPELMATHRYRYQLATELKLTDQAASSLKVYQELKDSTLNMTNQRLLMEVEMKYAIDKAEHQNEVLQLENEVARTELSLLRWVVILGAIIIIALLALTYIIYSRHKLKGKLLMAEIDQLRWQLKGLVATDTGEPVLDRKKLDQALDQPLSDREFEILSYAIGNLSNSEIADKVFVSVNTVKFHLRNIYDKLGVGNRKEALQYAFKASN